MTTVTISTAGLAKKPRLRKSAVLRTDGLEKGGVDALLVDAVKRKGVPCIRPETALRLVVAATLILVASELAYDHVGSGLSQITAFTRRAPH